MDLEAVVDRLTELPGVVAVVLGGSRAAGRHRPDSDWDLGLYYRESLDANHVRALGFEGTVVDPGDWGRLVNGGAWFTIEGERVDILYRDLDFVSHWIAEAEAGRFDIDPVYGYVAGMATYVLAGELAQCRVLHGDPTIPSFPDALRRSAPSRWRSLAEHSLAVAENRALSGDLVSFGGLCSTAVIAEAQARLAESGEWALNEKDIAARAGLEDIGDACAPGGGSAEALRGCLERVREILA
ncbi:MAG: nucleotidyltransferase domain-containing protein [Actinomycetota bacterium]